MPEARILEWVAIFPRDLPNLEMELTVSPCIAGRFTSPNCSIKKKKGILGVGLLLRIKYSEKNFEYLKANILGSSVKYKCTKNKGGK